MTDDEWLNQQQRLHNLRSYQHPLPPLRTPRRRPAAFTLEQLEIAERWAARQESRTT